MTPFAPQEFLLVLPEITLAVCGMALLVVGSFGRGIGNRGPDTA